jgi:hypothetical protein
MAQAVPHLALAISNLVFWFPLAEFSTPASENLQKQYKMVSSGSDRTCSSGCACYLVYRLETSVF